MNTQKIKKIIDHLPKFMVKCITFCYLIYVFIVNEEYRNDVLLPIKLRERKTSFGKENKDKTFYIIRRSTKYQEGHYSILSFFLGHLMIAEKRGLIPVIDMKNYYFDLWQAEIDRGKENAWEYFYNQPSTYSLNDIKDSKNIILCNGIQDKLFRQPNFSFSKDEIQMWNRIYMKYIKLNDYSNKFLLQKIQELGVEEHRVLAVSLRRGIEWGAIVNCSLFRGYPKHLPINEAICKVKEYMREWNYDFIFLVIDDQEGLELFKQTFKDKLLFLEKDRFEFFRDQVAIPEKEMPRILKSKQETNIFERELNFLTEVNIMAKCSSIICARTTANVFAFIINGNKFENIQII